MKTNRAEIVFAAICLLSLHIKAQHIRADTLMARKNVLAADSAADIGNYEISQKYFLEAAQLYKRHNLWPQYKITLYKHINLYSRMGKPDTVEQMVTLADNEVNTSTPYTVAYKAYVKAFAWLCKGNPDKAIEGFNAALNHPKLPEAFTVEGYNQLGVAHWAAGNNELAYEYLNKCLTARQKLYGENSLKTAAVYNNLGLIFAPNEPEKSLEYYLKAYAVFEKLYGNMPPIPSLTFVYVNIGIAYLNNFKTQQALDFFDKALQLAVNTYGAAHPTVAFVHNNIAQLFLQKSSYEKAKENLLTALAIYQKNYGHKHPEMAGTLNLLGVLHQKMEKHAIALEYFQQALAANASHFDSKNYFANPAINQSINAQMLLNTLLLKAHSLEALHFNQTLKPKYIRAAIGIYQICDTLTDRLRQSRTHKNDKLALSAQAAEVYENAIRLCVYMADVSVAKKTWHHKAFYFNEKSKSAVLLESIADTKAKSYSGIPDNLLATEQQLNTEKAFYEQKLAQLTPGTPDEKLYREKLFAVNRAFENFTKELEKTYPNYYNLKYNFSVADIGYLQKKLQKNEALISYFNGEQTPNLYVFYVTYNGFKIVNIAKHPYYEKFLTAFRNSITLQTHEVYVNSSNQLYKQLLPFKIKANHLIIVPDGRMATVPFEALLTAKTKAITLPNQWPYLIHKCAVSYQYSATLMLQNQSTIHSFNNAAYMLAPVQFGEHSSAAQLPDLPDTHTEVQKIDSLFRLHQFSTLLCTHRQATEHTFKKTNLLPYSYVHLATHGMVNESKPELSELFLCKEGGSNEDGNLFTGEIFNLKLNARLVTLSACQTGLGKITRGEGIIGLSRALLYAGAQNVMVSQWTVNDASTAALMVEFYKNLLSGNSNLALALQKAKCSLAKHPTYAQPYYWAPFVLIGR